jgi:cytoskeletal protein RodZ
MGLLGEELKRERVLREISLREISEATKISIRILEAIENNNYKILPGGIFNRNFLRAYAQFIGLDPESVVNKYQQQVVNNGEDSLPDFVALIPEQKAPSPSHRNSILVVVAFLIVGLILFFLWYTRVHMSGKKLFGEQSTFPAQRINAFLCNQSDFDFRLS